MIRRESESDFSHALLYAGHGSCLESGGLGVSARNIQRIILEEEDSATLYRLKNWKADVVDRAIQYARGLVGTEYGSAEARRAVREQKSSAERPNRQFCTRYVAQAYEHAGIQMVENPDYCSPGDIEDSDALSMINECLRPAEDYEVDRAEGPNPLEKQLEAQQEILGEVRDRYDNDVQTMGQLVEFVVENEELDEEVAEIIRNSGFLELWKIDKKRNPHYYNYNVFNKKVPERQKDSVANFLLSEARESRKRRFEPTLLTLGLLWNNKELETLEILVLLYKRLIGWTEEREKVARRHLEG